MWINTRTEFTFGAVYGHLDEVAAKLARYGSYGGICDSCNTFGHIRWSKACKKAGIKPIYGVSIPVADDIAGIREAKNRRYPFNEMSFIAKNAEGLAEIYELTDLAHLQFYWRPVIDYTQVNTLSENVFILSGVSPQWDLLTHKSVFQELSPRIPYSQRNSGAPPVACIDNYYPEAWDTDVYEPFADDRKRERKTTPQHILSPREWLAEYPDRVVALRNLKALAEQCNVDLPFAPMVKYIGKDCIEKWCAKGAKALGVDITSEGEYKDRYEREMKLIIDKEYVDYFLVTADLIRHAKKKMAVGPARGSSAGSLVCYLMGITTIDPLEYDLYFERFIDVNRFDLPDIDVDFQDDKRHLVMKYLTKKYGAKNVAQLGNVNRLKPKSAITRFAKVLRIPLGDVEEVKDAIMERSGGDARANQCMSDTLSESDIGKKFLSLHPNMLPVTKIEAHASHTGIHAAAIIVCNEQITKYAGINSRDKGRIAMIDKKDAEVVNLLKIDALGLRTMSILAGVCDQIGKHYDWLYDIPTDDQETFDVFNAGRLDDIFQFSGPAIKGLAKQMPIDHMEDIAALSALGRPGPLSSGGANLYIQYRTGKKEVEYLANHPAVIEATKATYGVVIYQEQMLAIGRNYGCLSWGEVSELRKAASKSLGDEFFGKYKAKFVEGALSIGEPIESIEKVWKGINTMGSWAFNKSHAVSYGLVSYLCGYMKAHYPLEFLVANLNNSNSDSSALKILRDAVEHDGIKYEYINPMNSEREWSVKDGILYGGLVTVHGIGVAKANKFLKCRREGTTPPKGIQKSIEAGITPFKYLYPGKELYGDYYDSPEAHGLNGKVSHIKDCQVDGTFTVIGKMVKKNTRDANEQCFVSKRGGEYLTGDTTWINITIEDDTDSMMVKISTYDYEQLGKEVAETGKEDKDWYMVHGTKKNGWNLMFVKNIRKITRSL